MVLPSLSAIKPPLSWGTRAAIEKALKDGVEGILMTNPNNPTGRVWLKDEIKKL